MISRPVLRSSNVYEAADRFLSEVGRWAADCIATYQDKPPTNVHDQLTYTTGWEPWIVHTQDADTIAFLKAARDQVAAHFAQNGMWRHGYWKEQEAHHGTEHFELFMGFLHRLDPQDERTKRLFLDAAEHIGNWCPEIPSWYNEQTGLFYSFHLGTEHIGHTPDEPNVPAHLRYVNMCLIAGTMSGNERYLRFAERYMQRWAEAIMASEDIPRGLLPSGPVYALVDSLRQRYGGAVGQVCLDSNLGTAEALLASDGIGTLLKMWQRTGDDLFLSAAERLLDIIVTQVADPDAGVGSDAIRQYREVTGNKRYDAAVLRAVQDLPKEGIDEIGIEPAVERKRKPTGIGKRSDMPSWFENGQPRRFNPITLALAAEIEQDAMLATQALDLGRTYLLLARDVYPDGRDHGCSARSVSAIARGHGRDNNAGVTTAVLAPLLSAWREGSR